MRQNQKAMDLRSARSRQKPAMIATTCAFFRCGQSVIARMHPIDDTWGVNNPLPDPNEICRTQVAPGLLRRIEGALFERYGDMLDLSDRIVVHGASGRGAAHLTAAVGPPARPHVFELFVMDVPGQALDGAFGVLVDFLDGSLEEFFAHDKDAYFPLDFAPHDFVGHTVYAKSAVVDKVADDLAARLLTSVDDDGEATQRRDEYSRTHEFDRDDPGTASDDDK
jgi:hypothetical protein